MSGKNRRGAPLILLLAGCLPLRFDLRLARPFSEHAVLQRNEPIPVWGFGQSGDTVSVELAGKRAEAPVDELGRWRVDLEPLPAGGPHVLSVRSRAGAGVLEVGDILVGEVWLCAGQSNMGMRVRAVADAEQEIAAASLPQIRKFSVTDAPRPDPAQDVDGEWVVCGPETAGDFSATAYFFGRSLHRSLEVPIGLLDCSSGGTSVEAWTNLAAQEAVPELAPALELLRLRYGRHTENYDPERARIEYERALEEWEKEAAAGQKHSRKPKPPSDPSLDKNCPGNLYNGMISPLVGYRIRGVIWYQGEKNAGVYYGAEEGQDRRRKIFPHLYALQLTTLIRSWREAWGQGDSPFYFVQLANYLPRVPEPVVDHGLPVVREQMTRVAATVTNTGMVVAIDIGEGDNIHPRNKQAVGERLARLALSRTYGLPVTDSGPVFERMELRSEGIALEFGHAEGLQTVDGADPVGFALAGADRTWHAARARIEATSVLVWSQSVPEPVAVRYAWAPNPPVNLVNGAGLPLGPFRTDDWPVRVPFAIE